MASTDLRDELNCSVCLNIFSDPVLLSCGHNFCRVCIGNVLDTQSRSGVYTCPECRAEFQERPALQKNRTLNNIAERFLSTQPKQEGHPSVSCTYCDHDCVRAVKTCLQCETSLCDSHLKIHNKSLDHVLLEPTSSLKDRKCSVHNEVFKYYCCDDAVSICTSCCLAKEHKGHEVELLTKTSAKKKAKLRTVQERLTSKNEAAEKKIEAFQAQRKEQQEKTHVLMENIPALFKDLRKQLKVLQDQILIQISSRQKQDSLRAFELVQQLELEKAEMAGKISHIKELCSTEDPLTVLKGWKSYVSDFCDIDGDEVHEAEDGDKGSADKLDEGFLSVTIFTAIDEIVAKVKREGFVTKVDDLQLDLKTAAKDVAVSSDRKSASWSKVTFNRSKTRERFASCQVLSDLSVSSGRHYWQVETSDSGIWRIGASYPSIDREGDQSSIGDDKKSWCLYMFDKEYSVIHNSKEKPLRLDSHPKKIGIYLDYEAGRLSFYELCDCIKHLHTFTAAFTEPLHAAFRVYMDGWVTIRN